MIVVRSICFVAGVAVLAALCHRTIMIGSGYGSPDAGVTIAATLLVIALAATVGIVWRHFSRLLAVLCVLCLAAGDLYQLGRTVTQEMQAHDAAQAPAVAAMDRWQNARAQVAAAHKRVAEVSANAAQRNTAATVEFTNARRSIQLVAKARHCGSNCRRSNAKILAAAIIERDKARSSNTGAIATAHAKLDAATLAFGAISKPRPVSSAASVLGWSAQSINAILAGLKASSMNIGAIIALAIAGHGLGGPARIRPVDPPRSISSRDHVGRFAVANYVPDPGKRLRLSDARADYERWSRKSGEERLDRDAFASELHALASGSGLAIEVDHDGQPAIVGMAAIQLLEAPAAL